MDRQTLRSFAHAVRARSDQWIERLRVTLDRAPLRVIAPGILFLSLFPFVIALIRVELAEPLFGDTAMMQFTGWGIRHGLRLYRDTERPTGRTSTSCRRRSRSYSARAIGRCASETWSSRSPAVC